MRVVGSRLPRAVTAAGRTWVRLRFAVLGIVGMLVMMPPYFRTWHTLNEWNVFEVGARTIVHFRGMWEFGGGALHLYSNNPVIQVGPPPILALAAFQWANPQLVAFLFATAMVLMGVASVFALERMAGALLPADRMPGVRVFTATMGIVAVGFWSREVGHWRHLDDALTVFALTVAMALCARREKWWLVAVLLGFGIASKPWAVVLAPMLLGVPRERRAHAFLVMLASAGVWWLPFIVADHGTMSALSSYHITPRPGSWPFIFVGYADAQHWVRPVQMLVATAVALAVAARGQWFAVPFAALATRVVTDPFLYSYYSMGPIIAAVALDFQAIGRGRPPLWVASTIAMLYGVPQVARGTDLAVLRLAWLIAFVILLTRPIRTGPRPLVLRRRLVPAAAKSLTV